MSIRFGMSMIFLIRPNVRRKRRLFGDLTERTAVTTHRCSSARSSVRRDRRSHDYLSSTVPPASSSFFLIVSASALARLP